MKKNNQIIKQCVNCDRYFIPKGRNDTMFCDAPSPQDSEKTCKEIGPLEIRKKKLKNDPIAKTRHQEYTGYLAFKILIPIALVILIGTALWLLVPTSVFVTNVINDTYANSSVSENKLIEKSTKAQETNEKSEEFQEAFNQMIEKIAVIIVTTCVIPLVVLFSFTRILKLITGLNIPSLSFKKLPKSSKIVKK